MGKLFDEYTESGYIVGEDNNPESKNIEMAISQNEMEDTSCALNEDEDNDDDEEEDEEDEEKPVQGYKDAVEDDEEEPTEKTKVETADV